MGTGEFAVPALQAMIASEHDVAVVISQPDKPRGRGLAVEQTPVARTAGENKVALWQPDSLKGAEPRKDSFRTIPI